MIRVKITRFPYVITDRTRERVAFLTVAKSYARLVCFGRGALD